VRSFATQNPTMNANPLHYLGCDRSDAHLDFTLLSPDLPVETFRLPSRAAAIEAWLAQWRRRFPTHELCVCFEQPAANLIVLLSRFDYVRMYPVNPATLKSYREAFVTSRAKDDPTDSHWLADLVRTHRDQLTGWAPQSPEVRQLTALVEQRRRLVDLRTMLSNQLTSLVKDYYPEALDLIGEHVASTVALDFLHRWPTLQRLQAARWSTIEAFYREHRSGRADTLERRRTVIEQARPLTGDPAILEPARLYLQALVAQLQPLLTAIEQHDEAVAAVFAAHPDHLVIASLPGAGPTLAPRLLAALGDDRTRFADARALQCFSGTAPVLVRSGQATKVCRRHACPTFIRQSFHEYAAESIRHSHWARAYYEQQKQRGKKHHTIARALAFKWQRILWRCWQDRTPYDETIYLHALKDHNPALYQLALTTVLPKEKQAA
jgi:transposase